MKKAVDIMTWCHVLEMLGKRFKIIHYFPNELLASCLWRPTPAHGLGTLTEIVYLKSSNHHYQSKVIVCVSVLSGRLWIIAQMQSISFFFQL